MAGTLYVIWWRDIPAQVLARGGGTTHKVVLNQRFQVAIDRAADVAGKNERDAYLAEWHRVGRRCGDDVVAEATAEAVALEARFDRAVLQRLVEAGGVDSERTDAPAPAAQGGAAEAPGPATAEGGEA